MSFCPKCGNVVGEGERFCGKCGTAQVPAAQAHPAHVQKVAPQRVNTQNNFANEHITQYEAQMYLQKTPTQKRRRFILIGGIAAAVAVLAAVFFIFILPLFSSSNAATGGTAFSSGGNDYYASPYLMKLNGDGAPDIVTHKGDESEGGHASSVYLRATRSGNTIYEYAATKGFEEGFIKLEFTSADTVKESRWVTAEAIENNPFSDPSGKDNNQTWIRAIYHMQNDGRYAYFTLVPSAEFAATQWNIRGRIGRISFDGKTIEEVPGINARDFVVDGGWIYYFDDGYYYNEEEARSGKRNSTGVGIYKAKTDGSGKELVHEIAVPSEIVGEYEYAYKYLLCGGMKMIGGKLCFLDYSAEGKGRLCRMDKNGANVEYLSESAVKYYTIDTEHNVAYYEKAKQSDQYAYEEYTNVINPEFAKYDIAKHQESAIPFVGRSAYAVDYLKGYLYFADPSNYQRVDGKQCGLRMNVATGQFEWLIYHDESTEGFEEDPETGRSIYKRTEGEKYLTWEKAEVK